MPEPVDTRYFAAISAVERLVMEGFTFVDIEEYIEGLPGLDEEQRSALWFLALAADNTLETQSLRRRVVIGVGDDRVETR